MARRDTLETVVGFLLCIAGIRQVLRVALPFFALVVSLLGPIVLTLKHQFPALRGSEDFFFITLKTQRVDKTYVKAFF